MKEQRSSRPMLWGALVSAGLAVLGVALLDYLKAPGWLLGVIVGLSVFVVAQFGLGARLMRRFDRA